MALRFAKVVSPLATLSVPVKLAADEIVWELIRPEVIAPSVALPATKTVAKRLVEDAVVEKKLVEVAAVVVERVIKSKILIPLNKLLFARSVEEAAVIVIFCEPSNDVPLIVRAFWRSAAVPAFPVIEPVMILPTVRAPRLAAAAKRLDELAVVAKKLVEVPDVVVDRVMLSKILVPLNLLLSARSVVEAELPAPQPVHVPTTRVPIVAVLVRRSVLEARPEV